MPASAALLAVGGYGRGELFPYSDVDVLVLLPNGHDGATDALRGTIEAFITACWDIGLEIGSSVRTIDECLLEARADVTVQTALLESRLLTGSRRMFNAFRRVNTEAMDARAFLRAKTFEMRQRQVKYEDTPYSLEPNCKESPGGLRDLQVLTWISRAAGLGRTWSEMAANGLLTRVRGQAAAAPGRHAQADPRAPAPDRGPARGSPGVRPADGRGRVLRLPRQHHDARVRDADAALLLGGEGRVPAERGAAAQPRGAHQRVGRPADAAAQRALPRPRRPAGGGRRRPVPARAARHPRDVPPVPDHRAAARPVGAHDARAVQRAQPDERRVPQAIRSTARASWPSCRRRSARRMRSG